MPRGAQVGVMQAEQIMDLTVDPDDVTEDEESGTLQDAVLDGDEEEEGEAGKVLSAISAVWFVVLICVASICLHLKFCAKACTCNHVYNRETFILISKVLPYIHMRPTLVPCIGSVDMLGIGLMLMA